MSLHDHSTPFVFFLSPRANYRDPILSPSEVFCGPDTEDETVGGRRRCVKTPAKPFDAPKFFEEQGIEERPDLVLVKADATGRTFPRNLGAFKCPKVLLVGVTHFLPQPIRKVIEYAKSEPFDFIIMDVTRHHAHWFREAGLKNVHWLPALEYNPLVRTVRKQPGHRLTFVGQAGAHHPFRKAVLERLKAHGFPLEVLQAPQAKAADIYSDSLATLNITLNGDINMRFFEGLAAGGFLLCDRLPEWSGLDRLFTAGEHFDLFGSYGELAEKLRYYFSKPDLVHRIKTAGQARLMEFHSPEVKRREFHDLIFNGIENPLYALDDEARTTVVVSKKPAMELLPAYEFFQELHRNRARLIFYCAEGDGERVRRFVDLPRVECRSHAGWDAAEQEESEDFPEERILHIGEGVDAAALEGMLLRSQPRLVFAPDGDLGMLAGWGFAQKEAGVFECARPVLGIVRRARAVGGEEAKILLTPCVDLCVNDAEALEVADAYEGAGLPEARKEALLRAVFLNRDCVAALIQLADLSLDAGALVDAALLLSEANRVAPLPETIAPVFQELMEQVAESPDIVEYQRSLAGGEHPEPKAPRRILVVTNLFPPQEMGGYGRKIWEFANGLKARGHTVEVLTSNSDYLGKKPDQSELALESIVRRELALMGEWKDGKTRSATDAAGQRKIGEANARRVLEAARRFKPDVVLLGNLDFLGVELLHGLLKRGISVIHSLGNQMPWYHAKDSIDSPKYVIAPASDWLGRNLLSLGYTAPRLETVYPGARIDRFYRHFLPDARRLRIAFAGLVMPYKGPQLLLDALVRIHLAGIDFVAEFAGDSIEPDFVEKLRAIAVSHGIGEKVRFLGFLSRTELSALFARSNVLVFPTLVPEAFGISQVEAMAGGLIVLTSGTGGTMEVVRHLKDGIVFDPKDEGSIADWLARLASNPVLRNRLQAQARERAQEFSVTASVVVIERIVEELLNKDSANSKPASESFWNARSEKSFTSRSATLEVAISAFNAGRLAEAEDVCRELLQTDEKCAGAWHLMARMAALNGDSETAGDFASVACELEPTNAGFLRTAAEVFLRRKELEQAEHLARRALELQPEASESLVMLGRVLAEKGERGNALEAFEKALRIKKDDAEAISHYAMALQKFDRGKDAISQIRKACSLEPDSVEHQTNFASLLEQNKRYVDALAAYGKAARMNPNVGYIWFRQGKLLNGLKRYAEAIPVLEKAIALPSPLGEFFYEMGLALHMSKRFPEALENYEKALATGYNTAALQCNRGVIFKDLRRGGESIMAFHSAVKMDPANVSYLNNLGAAALEIGLNTEALGCFEEAARQNPKLPTAQNNIGNLLKDRARGMDALPH
jgi:glycosyltransferase involved in cell wall biosynthesis/Tfp pilus assembly protein PilF